MEMSVGKVCNIHCYSIVLTKYYLEETGSIKTNSDSLSDNLSRVNQIVQDGVVDSHQGAAPGSLLLQLVGLPGGLGQDSPLGNEHHMLATELLLQLSDQSDNNIQVKSYSYQF